MSGRDNDCLIEALNMVWNIKGSRLDIIRILKDLIREDSKHESLTWCNGFGPMNSTKSALCDELSHVQERKRLGVLSACVLHSIAKDVQKKSNRMSNNAVVPVVMLFGDPRSTAKPLQNILVVPGDVHQPAGADPQLDFHTCAIRKKIIGDIKSGAFSLDVGVTINVTGTHYDLLTTKENVCPRF